MDWREPAKQTKWFPGYLVSLVLYGAKSGQVRSAAVPLRHAEGGMDGGMDEGREGESERASGGVNEGGAQRTLQSYGRGSLG